MITTLSTNSSYQKLEKRWLKHFGNSRPAVLGAGVECNASYRNIDTVIQGICSQEIAKTHPWILATFNGIEAAMHFARVAHGNEHLANLEKIGDANGMRWIKAHSQHV